MERAGKQDAWMRSDIAIIGLGGIFPDANNIEAFWQNILEGRDSIGEVPVERWNPEFFYHPDREAPDRTYTKIGAFIRDFAFDSTRYKIPPATAGKMDRTQQLAICAVDQALQDAKLSGEVLKEKKTAVILGNSMGGELTDLYALRIYAPWLADGLVRTPSFRDLPEESKRQVETSFQQLLGEAFPVVNEDSLPGELPNIISGRVASAFDLNGQNCTVDAACASSMAALTEAVRALRVGDVDVAITGGVDSNMAPPVFVKFSKIGALSPDGSRPFDKKANGFVMGEGAGILILKRLDDALQDKDRVYAVIKGVGSSSDGRGKGITAPNPEGQRRAIRRALASSGISASTIGLVEAHGTGTAVGDQTEATVLREIWDAEGAGKGRTAIGSIKSQIGHLKSAAGAASLIKVCLALHKKTIPPTRNCDEPIPSVNTEGSPFFIPERMGPWEANGTPRRAAASAFGFGGTNFHIVLEEATAPSSAYDPMIIGEEDRNRLCGKLKRLCAKAISEPEFRDLVRKESERARDFPARVALAVSSTGDFQTRIKGVLSILENPEKDELAASRGLHFMEGHPFKETKIAFLFPGQGSQYAWMLHDLADRFPVVRDTFDEADRVLAGLIDKPLSEYIFSEEGTERAEDYLRQTKITQPAVLTADIAVFRLLTSLGVTPQMVAGHSLGEYAACVAAGILTFPEALHAVSLRGRAMSEIDVPDPGKMASMTGDEQEARALMQGIPGYLDIANKNGPRQTVVAGESGPVDTFIRRCAEREIPCVELKVSAAFHSKIVASAKAPFGKVLRELDFRSPAIPLYANVTGEPYPAGEGAPAKIRELLNEQFAASVEWVKTMEHMYRDGARIFIECGPKRILANLAQMNLDARPGLVAASNHHKKPGMEQLCTLVALLRAHGKKVNWIGDDDCGRVPCAQPKDPSPEEWGAVVGDLADQPHFETFMKMQAPVLKEMLRAGYEQFAANVIPMMEGAAEEKAVRQAPPVITGYAVGLPSRQRRLFDPENLDDIMDGRGFIAPLPEEEIQKMLEKRVERVKKTPEGETYFHTAQKPEDVIQLAGRKGRFDLLGEYGVEERLTRYLDGTSELAVAAALEALRDAGIPLVREYVHTTTGQRLPSGWRLPEPIRDDFGVIYASAFPGADFLIREISSFLKHRFGGKARKELIDTFSSVIGRIKDPEARDELSEWFANHYTELKSGEEGEVYSLGYDFIFKALTLGHSHVAQIIGARGPNTHVNGACASTTQAIVVATDWIASGRAKRVLVVGADDPTNETLMQWMGSGMLAAGAATIEGRVEEASLPFDNRRNGMILGMGAVGLVLEAEQEGAGRGVKPVAQLLEVEMGNSAFHVSRLDVDHISGLMERLIARWEQSSGKDRSWLARNLMFMSHETYTPKRGGSAQAEVEALRRVFGPLHRDILISNVKGHTGHPFGAGLEDGVVLASLERGEVPPLANFRDVDPELGSLNYSRGGSHGLRYALRLAAGFGSQICLTLLEYKGRTRQDRTLPRYDAWLKEVVGKSDVHLEVVKNVLRVTDDGPLPEPPEEHAQRPEPRDGSEEEGGGRPKEEPPVRETPPQGAPAEAKDEVIPATVLAMIAEKTGYPEDMLDPDLDLEADLGIDTVKQAELFGQVRKAFDIPKVEGLKIADFPTITHLIDWVKGQKGVPAAPDSTATGPDAGREGPLVQSEVAAPDETGTGTGDDSIPATVLAMIAEKTGYPEDMLEPDLDLEADLGIDTVKQAELFGQVRKAFDIPKVEGLKIADFPTITHLINWVRSQTSGPSLPDTRTPVTEDRNEEDAPARQGIDTLVPVLSDLRPLSDRLSFEDRSPVLIAGGPEDAVRYLCEQLGTHGIACTRVSMDSVLKDDSWTGTVGDTREMGVINLFGLEERAEQGVYATFALHRGLAAEPDVTIHRLLAATPTGGTFCLESPQAAEGATHAGGICGSTKAFQQEFAGVSCKVLDLDPRMGVEQQVGCILDEYRAEGPLEVGRGQEGRRSGISLVPLSVPEGGDVVVGEGSVVLATGGAKGITAECLKTLIAVRPCRLAVIGTSPEPPGDGVRVDFTEADWAEEKQKFIEQVRARQERLRPSEIDAQIARMRGMAEVARNLAAFRDAGAQVRYLQADVSDAQSLEAAVKEIRDEWGTIDLVLHGAGREESKALEKKTQGAMEQLYDIKVAGFEHLQGILQGLGLSPGLWILFSSIAGRFGNAGQNDYSAANEALNFAGRARPHVGGPRVVVPNWGPWSETGMAARGSSRDSLQAKGVQFIPPKEGAEILRRLAAHSQIGGDILVAGRMGDFVSEEAIQTDDATKALKDRMEADAGPFSPGVLQFVPGERLALTLRMDPAETDFLDHHRINGRAVLPGVATVALFAWAAELVQPDSEVLGLRDITFAKPVKFYRDRILTIGVEITRSDEPASDGLIFDACLKGTLPSPHASLPGKETIYHRAKVIVGENRSDARETDSSKGLSGPALSKEQIYRALFHGPRFQVLESLLGWNDTNLEARIDEDNPSAFEKEGRFLTRWRPMAIEAAFQAAGMWTILVENKISLPFGVKSLAFASGAEPVKIVCTRDEKVQEEERTTYAFDLDVQDSSGQATLCLQGMSTIEMEELPESLRIDLPLGGEQEQARMVEEVVDITELKEGAGKEGEASLLSYLQPEERDVFRGFGSEQRAWAWLGGRVAAKKALNRYLKTRTGREIPFREIHIRNDELGKPVCNYPDVHVSISHKDTIAIACVVSEKVAHGVGIDLEFVSPRERAMWEQFFTPTEQELALRMARERESEQSTYFTHLWSIKEAVSKAVGLGLRVDSRQFEVLELSPEGKARVELHDLESAGRPVSTLSGKVSAWVEQRNGYVIARSLFKKNLAG